MKFWFLSVCIPLTLIAFGCRFQSHGVRSVVLQVLKYFNRPHSHIPSSAIPASRASWKRSDLVGNTSLWLHPLSDEEVEDVDRAVKATSAELKARYAGTSDSKVILSRMNSADIDFKLFIAHDNISSWRKELSPEAGVGVVVLRGVPVERWSEWEQLVFWWGLGLHLGVPGAQNGAGDLIGHVRDSFFPSDSSKQSEVTSDLLSSPNKGSTYNEGSTQWNEVRQYMTNEHIKFHCDVADVVGLLCLSQGGEGGHSRLASSISIFNEVQARRPDLIPLLFKPTPLDARGDATFKWFYLIPCAYFDGVLRTYWHSEYFLSAYRYPSSPATAPSPALQELVDLYESIANDPEYFIETEFLVGDVQLISNHVVVHSRTSFTDTADKQRHLLRLWLSLPFIPTSDASTVPSLNSLSTMLLGRALSVSSSLRFIWGLGKSLL